MNNDLSAEQLRQPVTITLPLSTILSIVELEFQPKGQPLYLRNRPATGLPAIGATWANFDPASGDQSGIYAGLSIENERPVALVLLPGELPDLDWVQAMRWAQEQGNTLPSRIDHLVLYKNLKREFKEEAYWSDAPSAGDDSFAWYQHFGYGLQSTSHKSRKLRARAVRRIAI